MATKDRDEVKSGVAEVKSSKQESFDPRDTDHPTGPQQAAENTANDPPS